MAETPPKASPDQKYLYGTPEELANRTDKGYPPTESNFSQIRPSTSPSSGAANSKDGPVKNNRAKL